MNQSRNRLQTMWVKPWIGRRLELGQYSRLLEELRLEDVPAIRNFLRIEPEMFVEILDRVRDTIWKNDTFYRKALDPGLFVYWSLTSPFVTVMDISVTDRNLEPGDDPLLFSTDSKGSFRCTQPQTVMHTTKPLLNQLGTTGICPHRSNQPTQDSNPGASDHESQTLCVSPPSEDLDPGLKLALTLRYLASRDSYHSLMYSFRVPVSQ